MRTAIFRLNVMAALLMGCLSTSNDVSANSGLCANGSACFGTPVDTKHPERHLLEFASALQIATAGGGEGAVRRAEMSDQEYFSFSGVGAIVCSIDGTHRTSTAFLVGAFDIGVTVAHTFEKNGIWIQPDHCVYTSTDSLGQICERIPVSYIKAQWKSEDGAFGQPAKDFAVVRLSQPSRFAQRTMPLGKFSGVAAPVLMIGFKSDIDTDALKRKSRGTVYERRANGVTISSLAGFVHDMDSRGIAAGAPVIDERSGVIIGIHTTWGSSDALTQHTPRNTMVTMNEWLEQTLRVEMQTQTTAKQN